VAAVRVPVVLLAVFFLVLGAVPACTVNQVVGSDLALLPDGGDDDDGGVDGDDDGGVEDEGDGGPRDGGPRDGGGDYLTGFPSRAQ
jgi:hypothetical protein